MIRAATNCRKSGDDTGKDVEARSVERQRDAALRYAAEQGWTVDPAHEFVDQSRVPNGSIEPGGMRYWRRWSRSRRLPGSSCLSYHALAATACGRRKPC